MLSMEEIYQEYANAVYRYLMSLTREHYLAEELTQETFYQAVRSIGRYDGSCKITTWLFAIAKNQLLAYRRKHPEQEELTDTGETRQSAENEFLAGERQREIDRLIRAMKEPVRETLTLRLYAGLSFREIGEILGKTENWARVTFYRGKEALKKEIEKNEI